MVPVKGAALHLDIQPGLVLPGPVQAGDEADLFFEGGYGQEGGAIGEAFGENGLAVTAATLARTQGAQLRQREVDGIEATVLAGPGGEVLRHVRGPVQVDVVEHHRHTVAAQHHVLFNEVRALRVGQRLCR